VPIAEIALRGAIHQPVGCAVTGTNQVFAGAYQDKQPALVRRNPHCDRLSSNLTGRLPLSIVCTPEHTIDDSSVFSKREPQCATDLTGLLVTKVGVFARSEPHGGDEIEFARGRVVLGK
jgi:hypothetical protein